MTDMITAVSQGSPDFSGYHAVVPTAFATSHMLQAVPEEEEEEEEEGDNKDEHSMLGSTADDDGEHEDDQVMIISPAAEATERAGNTILENAASSGDVRQASTPPAVRQGSMGREDADLSLTALTRVAKQCEHERSSSNTPANVRSMPTGGITVSLDSSTGDSHAAVPATSSRGFNMNTSKSHLSNGTGLWVVGKPDATASTNGHTVSGPDAGTAVTSDPQQPAPAATGAAGSTALSSSFDDDDGVLGVPQRQLALARLAKEEQVKRSKSTKKAVASSATDAVTGAHEQLTSQRQQAVAHLAAQQESFATQCSGLSMTDLPGQYQLGLVTGDVVFHSDCIQPVVPGKHSASSANHQQGAVVPAHDNASAPGSNDLEQPTETAVKPDTTEMQSNPVQPKPQSMVEHKLKPSDSIDKAAEASSMDAGMKATPHGALDSNAPPSTKPSRLPTAPVHSAAVPPAADRPAAVLDINPRSATAAATASRLPGAPGMKSGTPAASTIAVSGKQMAPGKLEMASDAHKAPAAGASHGNAVSARIAAMQAQQPGNAAVQKLPPGRLVSNKSSAQDAGAAGGSNAGVPKASTAAPGQDSVPHMPVAADVTLIANTGPTLVSSRPSRIPTAPVTNKEQVKHDSSRAVQPLSASLKTHSFSADDTAHHHHHQQQQSGHQQATAMLSQLDSVIPQGGTPNDMVGTEDAAIKGSTQSADSDVGCDVDAHCSRDQTAAAPQSGMAVKSSPALASKGHNTLKQLTSAVSKQSVASKGTKISEAPPPVCDDSTGDVTADSHTAAGQKVLQRTASGRVAAMKASFEK